MKTAVKAIMAISFIFSTIAAQAQCPGCVVQDSLCPASTQEMQLCGNSSFTATSGDAFEGNVTFALPVSMVIRQGDPIPFVPFPFPGGSPFDIHVFVDTIFLTSVTGLPPGVSWESDSSANGNHYLSYSYQYGCVKFCGDLDCGLNGPYNVSLNFQYTVTYGTSDPNFQAILDQLNTGPTNDNLNVTITVDPSTNLVLDLTTSGTTTVIDSGQSITLTATSGFDTYDWSSGETVETITVSPADTTTYVVTVSDAFGCTQTDSVEVQVLAVEDSVPPIDTTGITSIGYNDPSLRIYPNPTQGSFTISVAQPMVDGGMIEILDITGKRVAFQPVLSINNILTLDAPKGLYIVKVISDHTIVTRKLLIH